MRMDFYKTTIAFIGLILLVNLPELFACHQGNYAKAFSGHYGERLVNRKQSFNNIFHYSTMVPVKLTEMVAGFTLAYTDGTATTTNCKFRSAYIHEFFNNSYLQIAEESAQGHGPHLEVLASFVGCNERQTAILESAMKTNYSDLFKKNNFNDSVKNFYALVNNDEELKTCWPA